MATMVGMGAIKGPGTAAPTGATQHGFAKPVTSPQPPKVATVIAAKANVNATPPVVAKVEPKPGPAGVVQSAPTGAAAGPPPMRPRAPSVSAQHEVLATKPAPATAGRAPTPPRAPSRPATEEVVAKPAVARAPSRPATEEVVAKPAVARAPSRPAAEEVVAKPAVARAPSRPATEEVVAKPAIGRAPSRPATEEVVGIKTPDVVTEPLWRGDRPKSRPAVEELATAKPPAFSAAVADATRAASAPGNDDVTVIRASPLAAATPAARAVAPAPMVQQPTPTPLAPVESALVELQRRVEELERGPNTVPPQLQQRIDALKARAHATPGSIPPPGAIPAVVGGGLVLGPTYARSISVAPPPPTLAVTGDVDIDTPFDGRARRRKVVIGFVIFLLLVFGGLVGAMAYSYSPQARVLLTR
jgi:hypothetical protein